MSASDNFQIRVTDGHLCDAIDAVQRVCYPLDAQEKIEAMQCHWRLSPGTCFTAEVNGRVVGYLLAHPWVLRTPPPINTIYTALPPRPNGLYLHDLAVAPEAKGRGLAARLVDAVFASACRQGLRRCSLISVQRSRAFWERFGFRVVEDLPPDFFRDALEHYRDPGCRYMETDLIC